MQVTHIEEAKSHVVVGGQNVRAFGMSDTAEFFELLSNALYSNKRMAVVREVLCNAWDAHIASMRTDIPVEIMLDDQKLVFKDHGFGIHDAVIGPIYCVYGNSTKSHNGEENGGFGLGSKAPFAYTDHFTVTSQHQGVKTVYAISRGSVETQGKPDFRTVVSVPTKDSGLEVVIPIKHPQDVLVFKRLIHQITLFGDMNVKLNGMPLPRLPFSSAPDGAMLISRESPDMGQFQLGPEGIWVRYGTVIYPVPDEEYYSRVYNSLKGLTLNNKYILVLQAPPNKISVTPSRESLSMTEMTKNTCKTIMEEALNKYKAVNSTHIFYDLADLAGREVSKSNINDNTWAQLAYNLSFHNIGRLVDTLGHYSTSFYDIKRFLMAKTTDFRGPTYINPTIQRAAIFEALARYAPNKKRLTEIRMLRRVKDVGWRYYNRGDMLYWALNHYRLTTIENLLRKEDAEKLRYVKPRSYGRSQFTPFADFNMETHSGPINDSFIVVAMNQDDLLAEARAHGREGPFIGVYQPRKKGQKERIINALERAGYSVYDGTSRTVLMPKKTTPVVKKDKGYLLLSESLDKYGCYEPGHLSQTGKKRVLHPTVCFHEATRDHQRTLDGWRNYNLEAALELVPDIVVVSSERTYLTLRDKYKTQLALPFLVETVETMLDDPTSKLVEYLAYQSPTFSSDISLLSKIGELDPEIGALVGISYVNDPKTIAAANVLTLWMNYGFSHMARNLYQKAHKVVEEYQAKSKIIEKVEKNPALGFLDLATIHEVIKSKLPASKVAKKLLLEALKG